MAEEKNIYDPRGRLSNLRRLRAFDMEALIHLISYRLLIIASLLTAVFFVLSLAAPALQVAWKILLVLDWIFFSTQVFETLKGLMLTGSVLLHVLEDISLAGKNRFPVDNHAA